jgi:hypothetical protein
MWLSYHKRNWKLWTGSLFQTHRFPLMKGRSDLAVTDVTSRKHVDLPPLVSVEVTGVFIPTGNGQNLTSSYHKSPRRAWRNADIIAPLILRCKWIRTDDLNSKHELWTRIVPNPPCGKPVHLFDKKLNDTSALRCSTHYSPAGSGYVFEILLHQNVRLSDVIVYDSLGHIT